ncbi:MULTISPECIES: hypothetical protein [Actinoplanes]|uniref:hypothetical protein n=1 Tax=Actinoplanes TaxID=1865 RepID=UPI000A6B7E10|nr:MULTISPECIES: hypothetical protein [Actinoplanes]GLY07895.1 hypothetical protein Acsp01_82740 [Actinoplanes sp. NBRC 101535]
MTDLTTSSRPEGGPSVARAVLLAGGSFATAIGSILGAAGVWGLGERVVLQSLVALCVITAVTMTAAARVADRRSGCGR